MNDSIFVYKDYGNIKFDIKSIMDRKNISVNQIVKKTGLHIISYNSSIITSSSHKKIL